MSEYDLAVTGANGFLGSHIVRSAVAQGLLVLATGRTAQPHARLAPLQGKFQYAPFDIDDPAEHLDAVLGQTRAIVHCAAYGVDARQSDLAEALRINVLGSLAVQAAAARAEARFIHIGTSYEYGPSPAVQDESFCPAPRGIYGVSKAAATMALLDRAASSGCKTLILRPFGMYGPDEGVHKLTPLVMRSMLLNIPLDLTAGEQIRDYVYVGDVAQACMVAARIEKFPNGRIINLASGMPVRLRDFVQAAACAVRGDMNLLRWGARPYRPHEVMATQGTYALARHLLDWQPQTSLHAGMALTAAAEKLRTVVMPALGEFA